MKKNNSALLVYVPEVTPRVEYTFEFVFQTILGLNHVFTSNPNEFLQSDLPKINYSPSNLGHGLYLKAHPILFEKSIVQQEINVIEYQQHLLFFSSSEDSLLPFDPLACTFYLLTRYEEYFPEHFDEHERFPDSENLLVRLGLHKKAIVDRMAYWLAEKISGQYGNIKFRKRNFQFLTTIDIDNAWAFKNKSFLVSLGAGLKAVVNLRFYELSQRLAVILRLQKDPYDTYKYILDTYKGLLSHIQFFFLIGDRNQYDKNISHKKKPFRQLIINLASICDIGIHPSYESNHKLWLFEKEKERLEDIIQQPITSSRQHFLKLQFPKTYQNLLKSGITDDYTLGFAALVGFRAGTCTAFPFFDLSRNQCTELTIHPFQVMDVSLKNYMHLDAAKASTLIEELMLEVKQVNGTFVSLWHNESLKNSGQWRGWRNVFELIKANGLILENE